VSVLPVPGFVAGPATRFARATVNGLEFARFGGLRTDDEPSPFEVVARRPIYRLRRYFPDVAAGERAPVLLVPPLMLTAEVWDVSSTTSAVAQLAAQDIEPWVVDFGDPAREAGGGRRDVTDHVLAVAEAIGKVREATGRDVHIGGYSQGGLFCYQATALRGNDGVASIVALGTPLRGPAPGELGVPPQLLVDLERLSGSVLGRTGLPGWLIGPMFRLANPVPNARRQLEFLLALHDREALLPREGQRRFLAGEGWIAWPGPAIAELVDLLVEERYMKGGLVFGDRTVSLAEITCPVLIFVGETDEFGPPPAVRAIGSAAPRAEVYECLLPVGHFGLGVGRQATTYTWPGVADWVRWNAGSGELPEQIHRLDLDADDGGSPSGGVMRRAVQGAGLAVWAGVAASRAAVETGALAASTARHLGREAVEQVPRLVRLERMSPGTQVSYGRMLDEGAAARPDAICFLFEGRGHTNAQAKRRIDSVVRGLLSLGVRRGDHVGVLMATRPSVLVAVAALNRLGAVAVLLRPGGQVAREAQLGGVSRVVADPEHAAGVVAAGLEALVLGGGAEPRDLGPNVVDMERIDPDAVTVPGWYRANPGRARDVAFILFSGTGERTSASRITNGRWALSAFGAASSAALTRADTVYAVSPLHHPAGLLLATAAPAAAGARLAMAPRFDAETFWPEVRRYGATVVTYTWTMLQALVEAPPHPEERHHPIRLFVGSAMPANLWRRVRERFGPAHVLELYASTRSGAILANVSGRKVGAMGRPLPGTPRVRIVGCDPVDGTILTGDDGFAVASPPEETGMLLVAVDPATDAREDTVLYGVFGPDDAWTVTGDLFRRDRDGDLWLVDGVGALIRTEHGVVSPRAVEEALGRLDAVDLAACYRTAGTDDHELAVAAVTLREGCSLDTEAINIALGVLDPEGRPDLIRVVETMPVTSWFRPDTAALRDTASRNGSSPTWKRGPRSGVYRALKAPRSLARAD
jgi:putative long chain acyl-CoA synthase